MLKRLLWVTCLLMITACGEEEPNGPPVQVTQSTAPPPIMATTGSELAATPGVGFGTVERRDYILGNEDAFVTIIMYGDFQSPRSARYARDLEILRSQYSDDLRLIWRHLPDTQSNDKSALAFQAAEAAAAQGRFWDMHAILLTTQGEWRNQSSATFQETLIDYARAAGLNVDQFATELASERYLPLVEEYQAQADDLGIVGTPTLLVNGEILSDRDDLFGLNGAVQLALLARRHFDEAPPMTLDTNQDYRAIIRTAKGDIHLDLFEQDAPITVNNFIFLAENGWYDDTSFFLVIPGFYAQAGDPSETGRGYPGYRIPDEHDNGYIFDREGVVAMSHPPGEAQRAGSQFFITYGELPQHAAEWDGQYTIFGVVTDGMAVLRELTPRNPGDPLRFPNPPPGDRIITIEVEA